MKYIIELTAPDNADIIGVKEQIAQALEGIGDIKVITVKERGKI